MKNDRDLEQLLSSVDGKSYGFYKKIKGIYKYDDFRLSVDHVQVDPYAPPSRASIIIDRKTAGFPDSLLDSKLKRVAAEDFLSRQFAQRTGQLHRGSKNDGSLSIGHGGQEMLERTALLILEDRIEVRFEIGLPAAGRRILARKAQHLFLHVVPQIVANTLYYRSIDRDALKRQIVSLLDQEFIRHELPKRHLVAFIGNGSILPRASGVSDRPLVEAVPFKSPQPFETTFELPDGRIAAGMGIPEGITLIVGGGFHGKSTLLRALEAGVYNHIPGDGRELVVTRRDAVKIRAEDGRPITKVNISTFINHLPGNRDTRAFSTANASGSTSQAANVMEALEAGTSLLLIDEDTSATNFMIRDRRMKKLVAKDKEPITPFIDKVRPLYQEKGVSTVLIIGGSGDYFDVADRVIMMDEYVPKDVSDEARRIAREDRESAGGKPSVGAGESMPTVRNGQASSIGAEEPLQAGRNNGGANDVRIDAGVEMTPRIPLRSGFPSAGKKDRIKAKGRHTILYGKAPIDLSGLEQLVDDSQTNSIAAMIDFLRKKTIDDRLTLSEAADRLYAHVAAFGLESLSPNNGRLALPRRQELCAAINRYRGLKVRLRNQPENGAMS